MAAAENRSQSPIRFGILGAARIADKLAPAIRQAAGAELVAVASRSKEKAAAKAQEWGAETSYGSYEALLADESIDAVYIPLPPSLHLPWTRAAAAAGKHVLCEKPLAATLAEAEEMAAVCREAGVQLLDGTMWVHHPRSAEMRLFLQDGSLGNLRRVTSTFTFNGAEMLPENDFRWRREFGGGSLLDLGWYCVRASLWAFGGLPLRVTAQAAWQNEVDVDFSGWMWFAGDRVASFDCGFRTVRRKWFEIAGDQASLVCDDFTRPWDEEQARFWIHGPNGKLSTHTSPVASQEVCMIENFCRTLAANKIREDWAADAVATQAVCAALDQAARAGTVVELPAGSHNRT